MCQRHLLDNLTEDSDKLTKRVFYLFTISPALFKAILI